MRYLGFFHLVFFLFAGLGGSPMNPKIKKHVLPEEYASARKRMVEEQIRCRGIRDQRVLSAISAVQRHLFVPESYRRLAYEDGPLPIGMGQTISQPYQT